MKGDAMNPSYFRIKLPESQAAERLCYWIDKTPKESIKSTFAQSVANSFDDQGQRKGSCLYVYENEGWTVFEDLTGDFLSVPAASWQSFAGQDELVAAGYNDSEQFGQLIVITDGVIQKEFLENLATPENNVNNGDKFKEIKKWTDAAAFVDDDNIVYSDMGTVMIF